MFWLDPTPCGADVVLPPCFSGGGVMDLARHPVSRAETCALFILASCEGAVRRPVRWAMQVALEWRLGTPKNRVNRYT